MNDRSRFNRFRAKLRQNKIVCSDEWVENAISKLHSGLYQIPDSGPELNGLLENIRLLWLISDLDSMNCPTNLSKLPSTNNGRHQLTPFIVQIIWSYDIGKPALEQLNKLTKKENDNDSVQVTDNHPPPWEPKSRSHSWLEVSDGVRKMKAMEHGVISEFRQGIQSGTKLCIFGEVIVQNGILFLNGGNTLVIGGLVESLMELHSPGNVLSRALNRSPPAPSSRPAIAPSLRRPPSRNEYFDSANIPVTATNPTSISNHSYSNRAPQTTVQPTHSTVATSASTANTANRSHHSDTNTNTNTISDNKRIPALFTGNYSDDNRNSSSRKAATPTKRMPPPPTSTKNSNRNSGTSSSARSSPHRRQTIIDDSDEDNDDIGDEELINAYRSPPIAPILNPAYRNPLLSALADNDYQPRRNSSSSNASHFQHHNMHNSVVEKPPVHRSTPVPVKGDAASPASTSSVHHQFRSPIDFDDPLHKNLRATSRENTNRISNAYNPFRTKMNNQLKDCPDYQNKETSDVGSRVDIVLESPPKLVRSRSPPATSMNRQFHINSSFLNIKQRIDEPGFHPSTKVSTTSSNGGKIAYDITSGLPTEPPPDRRLKLDQSSSVHKPYRNPLLGAAEVYKNANRQLPLPQPQQPTYSGRNFDGDQDEEMDFDDQPVGEDLVELSNVDLSPKPSYQPGDSERYSAGLIASTSASVSNFPSTSKHISKGETYERGTMKNVTLDDTMSLFKPTVVASKVAVSESVLNAEKERQENEKLLKFEDAVQNILSNCTFFIDVFRKLHGSSTALMVDGLVRKIKGLVLNVTEKITINAAKEWTMAVGINDGSSMEECSFSDHVLATLITYTAEEAVEVKRSGTTREREAGKVAMRRFQEFMFRTDLVFHIHFRSNRKRLPQVLKVQCLAAPDDDFSSLLG